jgi:hypothetical protein
MCVKRNTVAPSRNVYAFLAILRGISLEDSAFIDTLCHGENTESRKTKIKAG